MSSTETEAVDLTYLVIGIGVFVILVTAVIIQKDVIFGLFDTKLSTRHVGY